MILALTKSFFIFQVIFGTLLLNGITFRKILWAGNGLGQLIPFPHTKKDKVNFFRYSFGSIKESFDWTEKAKKRKLITDEDYQYIFGELQKLPRELDYLIKFTKEKLAV
jgi:hypothetical protein